MEEGLSNGYKIVKDEVYTRFILWMTQVKNVLFSYKISFMKSLSTSLELLLVDNLVSFNPLAEN